jgi:RHS repeat-associated protein
VNFEKPQAFLVYITFDKNMKLDPMASGVLQVGDANALGKLSKEQIVARNEGFFYTYVTNRSEARVNFDNLTIRHWKPVVRVHYDYYPYGLTWNNPPLPTDPEGIHNCTYQDKEFQFAEFSDGSGLALYDFQARMYDPTIGRWSVPDPAGQFANPYLAMCNNPIRNIDPDGLWGGWDDLIVMGVGAVVNTVAHWDQITEGGFHWDKLGEAVVVGAVGAELTYVTGGALLAAAGGVGAGGFLGGFAAGAIASGPGSFVLSEGNHECFNDPRWSNEQYAFGALTGGVFGGIANGFSSYSGGRGFWRGTNTSAQWGGRSASAGNFAKGFGTNSAGKIAEIKVEEATYEWVDDAERAFAGRNVGDPVYGNGLVENPYISAEGGFKTLSELGLKDGMSVSSSGALELGEQFLGNGYKELVPGGGRYVSADGTRVFRMGVSDITGVHGGGPHVNFETLIPNPAKAGKMMVDQNFHIYLTN